MNAAGRGNIESWTASLKVCHTMLSMLRFCRANVAHFKTRSISLWMEKLAWPMNTEVKEVD